MDASNVTVAELQPRTVSVSEPAQVPLALVTVQPAQGAQRVDTKAQIALFFNQSIDASQLEVTVCETAFDTTWLIQDTHGSEFLTPRGSSRLMCSATTKALKWSCRTTFTGQVIFNKPSGSFFRVSVF